MICHLEYIAESTGVEPVVAVLLFHSVVEIPSSGCAVISYGWCRYSLPAVLLFHMDVGDTVFRLCCYFIWMVEIPS